MRNPTLYRGLAMVLCVQFFALALPARAQTPSPTPEWHYSEGHLLDAYTHDTLPKWDRVVGLSTATAPKYEGDNAYTTSYGPSFDIRYRDIAFISAGEGIGVNLLHDKTYRVGVALAYDLGRNNHVDHNVGQLGNYGISPEAKVFAEYLLFPVTFRVDLRHSFGGQGGYIGDLSLYMPLGGKEGKYFIFAGPSMTFADADNLRHTFGVSERQSASSGYPAHYLGGGIRSYSFGVSGGYFFSKHFLFEGFVSGEQLIGGAGTSPFVQERGQLNLQTTLAYRW